MNSRLENLIERYLGSYVQEYDSSSLSVNITFFFFLFYSLIDWNLARGYSIKKFGLSLIYSPFHLLKVLKSQSFDIGENLALNLVQGIIGEIRIQVPWTHIQSGQVQVTIENVHLVFRHDADLNSSTRSHKAKMVISSYLCFITLMCR
jgi:hypothetical protein